MRQRSTGQVIVDKRRLRTNTPKTQPEKNVGIRVLKVQRNNISLFHTSLFLKPLSVLEDLFVDIFVRKTLSFKDEQRAISCRRFGSDVFEEVIKI